MIGKVDKLVGPRYVVSSYHLIKYVNCIYMTKVFSRGILYRGNRDPHEIVGARIACTQRPFSYRLSGETFTAY